MSVSVTFTAIRANAAIIPTAEIYAELHAFTAEHCAQIITEVSEYPPEVGATPPNRPYVRTFHLLRSWRLRDESSGAGIQYRINNPVQDKWGRYYSGYVHGPSGQAFFHADHGWKNLRDYNDRDRFREGTQAIIQRRAL